MHPLRQRISSCSVFCLATAVGLLLCLSASAMGGTLSATYFRVDVASSLGNEHYEVLSTDPSIDYDAGTYTWSWSTGAHALGSVATLNSANLTIVGDPQIALGFALTAGEADTTVTVTTATLSFASLADPNGAAFASVTLTRNGATHTATLTGNGYAGSAYTAYLSGTPWDESPYLPYLETTTSTSLSDGTGGFLPISGMVSSIQVQYSFVLSAGDQASGSSNYAIIPEPASLALLAASGLMLLRRRRS